MAKRVYVVEKTTSPTTTDKFLVEASTPSEARNFIAQRDITVEVADQATCIAMGKAGAEVLIARPQQADLPGT